MRRSKVFQYVCLISLLVITSLACNLLSRVGDIAEEKVKETAGALITEIGAQITEVNMQTGEALITEVGAKITESGLMETVEAVSTDMPLPTVFSGERPDDIPLMDGDKMGLVESEQMITYMTAAKFQEVVDFYKAQMPANGWSKVDDDSDVNEDNANLVFEKDGRRATIIISAMPFIDQTTVVINIEE